MKINPVIRPGRADARKPTIAEMRGLRESGNRWDSIRFNRTNPVQSMDLNKSVTAQARKMRMNLQERKPLRSPWSGRILHTPIFSDLAIPRPAEMTDVRKVIKNKELLAPR